VSIGVWVDSVAAVPTTIESSATARVRAVRIGDQTQISPTPAPPTARYRVTVVSEWTAASHPTTFPANAHFSPIVVVGHGERSDLINPGGLATPGFELLAETGATGTLESELERDQTVTELKKGTTIVGAGSQSFEATLAQDSPLVSVVTMLAPTPDWIVGIEDESMFVDGAWVDRVDLDLEAYDAGTDSGREFISTDADTNPQQPISGPRDASFAAAVSEGGFGFVTIQRLT
jgi:Spondin_N